MKIGLLSDTHNYLEKSIFEYFADVDEIWHAGDIGTVSLLDELEAFKPTRAVFGNIDGHELRIRTQEHLVIKGKQQVVLITHIAGKPPRYNATVRRLIAQTRPTVLICGHSHILRVEKDKVNNLLFLNPGAAGKHGLHKVKTLLRFDIEVAGIKNMEVIELGPRGSLV